MTKKILISAVMFIGFFISVNSLQAATYYVDKENKFGKGCHNAWAGTMAAPKCDFDHPWFQTGLRPGDEVIVREASGYREVRLYIQSAGSAISPILIRAYEGEHININSTNQSQHSIRLIGDVSYVTFKDFDISAREYSFVSESQVNGNYGIKLLDCNIHDMQHGPRLFNLHDSEIKNCEIHDLTVNGVQLNNNSTNILFENVNAYRISDGRAPVNSDADGFHTYGGDGIVIKNCSSHDNSEDGFDMNANVTIINSKAYNNNGAGLKIWRRTQDAWAEKSALVINSLFYNNGYYAPDPLDGNPGIKVSDGAKLELYNSVVYGNYDQGVKIRWAKDDGSYLADKIYPISIIKNSIIAGTIDGPGLTDTYNCKQDTRNLQENPACTSVTHLVTGSNNIYFNNNGGNVSGYNNLGVMTAMLLTNDNYSDANFVNAASGDFTLGAGSPAIDAGLNLSSLGIVSLMSDFQATARPQSAAWDIGAYKFGAVSAANCFDGIMNQTETDIDCGGVCAACADAIPPSVPNGVSVK